MRTELCPRPDEFFKFSLGWALARGRQGLERITIVSLRFSFKYVSCSWVLGLLFDRYCESMLYSTINIFSLRRRWPSHKVTRTVVRRGDAQEQDNTTMRYRSRSRNDSAQAGDRVVLLPGGGGLPIATDRAVTALNGQLPGRRLIFKSWVSYALVDGLGPPATTGGGFPDHAAARGRSRQGHRRLRAVARGRWGDRHQRAIRGERGDGSGTSARWHVLTSG